MVHIFFYDFKFQVDALDMTSILKYWSLNCTKPEYFHKFVCELLDFPVSQTTVKLFSGAHLQLPASTHKLQPVPLDGNM